MAPCAELFAGRCMTRLRVLIAAFDGLQPSQVRRDLTPTIARLAARRGDVRAPPCRVPDRHAGERGQHDDRAPSGWPRAPRKHAGGPRMAASSGDPGPRARAGGARRSDGRVLLAPTLGEMLRPHGRTFGTVVGGTSGNAYVQHPRAARVGGAVLHPEFTLPADHHAPMVERLGPWPPKRSPETGRIRQAADVLLGYLLPDIDPDVALVWFPEPDTSQHAAGVGSPPAVEALTAADAALGRILDRARPARRRARRPGGVRPRVLHGRPPDPDPGAGPAGRLPARGCARRRDRGRERRRGPVLRARVGPRRPRTAGRVARGPARGPARSSPAGRRARRSGSCPATPSGWAGRAADVVLSFRWDSTAGANGFAGHADSSEGAPGLAPTGRAAPRSSAAC